MSRLISGRKEQAGRMIGGSISLLLPLAVYCYYLAPTIVAGDSIELITCAVSLGIPHPPGYPLFTMIGHLFSRIPMGEISWRINLVSALFSSLTCLFVYLTLLRLTNRIIPALGGALSLAFSAYFWHYSEVAEVFSLNCFFASLVIYLLVRFNQRTSSDQTYFPANAKSSPSQLYIFWLICFVFGLSLTNHHTIVFLIPGIIWFLWLSAPDLFKNTKILMIGASCLLLGLTPYLYPYVAALAEPAVNWDNPVTWHNFFRLITRADYGSFSLLSPEVNHPGSVSRVTQIPAFLKTIPRQFGFPFTLLILIGILSWRRQRLFHLLLWINLFFAGFFFVLLANMPIGNPLLFGVLQRFYLLPAVIFSMWMGLGVNEIIIRLEQASFGRLSTWLPIGILILCLGWEVGHNVQGNDFRRNFMADDFASNLLKSLPPGGLFFVRGDVASMGVDYLQIVRKERPDLVILDQEKLTYEWYYQQVKKKYPDIVLRGKRYDGVKVLNKHLISDNIRKRPVLFYGFKENSYLEFYKPVNMGLVSLIIPKEQPDAPKVKAEMMSYIYNTFSCRTPERDWPQTSFEYMLNRVYTRPCGTAE